MKASGERDWSAPEVSHLLLGTPLYHCSESFKYVNLKYKKFVKIDLKNTKALIDRKNGIFCIFMVIVLKTWKK